MLAIAAIACAAGIALLRLGWHRRRDVVVAGWSLLLLGLAALALRDGAWGLAVGACAATLAAAVALAHAALTTPARRARPLREPPSVRLPRRTARDLGRRLGVFVATVPAALAVCAFLGLALYRVALAPLGASDATVLGIASLPVAWTVLASVQLTRASFPAMLPPLAAVGAVGGLAWIAA